MRIRAEEVKNCASECVIEFTEGRVNESKEENKREREIE